MIMIDIMMITSKKKYIGKLKTSLEQTNNS